MLYDAGLQRSADPLLRYPYILVQAQTRNLRGATYEDLEKVFAQNANAGLKKDASAHLVIGGVLGGGAAGVMCRMGWLIRLVVRLAAAAAENL